MLWGARTVAFETEIRVKNRSPAASPVFLFEIPLTPEEDGPGRDEKIGGHSMPCTASGCAPFFFFSLPLSPLGLPHSVPSLNIIYNVWWTV